MNIERYNHHGSEVAVQSNLKGKHLEHCLCFQGCAKFKPDDREANCRRANLLYAFCRAFNMVTPVYECGEYESK